MNDIPVPGSGSPPEPGTSRGGFTADIAAGGRLSLELRRCGQAVVITGEGEIDLLVAEQLREALMQITGMVSEHAVYASRSDALADCSGGGPAPRPAPRIC